MNQEYYGTPTASSDFLAHYGVKGMKWGVRKALIYGDKKALQWHYKKASKKLKKLQDKGLNSKKYAKKAVAYGVAAAGTGTLAIAGPSFGAKLLGLANNTVTRKVGGAFLGKGGGEKVGKAIDKAVKVLANPEWQKAQQVIGDKIKPTNSALFRIGSGAATVGLGAAAAKNAYTAAHGPKYRKKAVAFKQAMDDAFSGVTYDQVRPQKKRKKNS